MKTKSVTAGLLTAALLMLLTACGRAGAETAAQTGNAAQIGPEPRTEEAAQTQSQQAPQETEKPESPVVYEQEGVYLAVTLPDGWEYAIRTAQDMDQKDDGMQCAIDFWPESSPEAVFSFGYQPQKFGICGTEAAVEPFTLQNGITGTMYTGLPGDSFWLTVIYKTAEHRDDGGTYLIMASPGAAVWETTEEEFLRIRDSVQVGNAPVP